MGSPSNIWRNNFNIQKGYGCFGTAHDFDNSMFRNQSRTLCQHLQSTTGELAGSTCALDAPTAPARYRREDHPKVFRIDPATREHFVYNPQDTSYYAPIILAPGGRKLPLAALIVCLYYDSIISAGRIHVDISDFMNDFGFTASEANTYFNDDPAMPEHVAIAAAFPAMFSWSRITPSLSAHPAPPAAMPGQPASLPSIPAPSPRRTRASPAAAIPTVSPPVLPPVGSHWWDAEQAVRQALVSDGWTVVDVSRFRAGYDLHAYKAGTVKHVEVKSSAGTCTPVLTENELLAARRLRSSYVLAIVENFNPSGPATILWVEDPAVLHMTARQSTVYSVPKSVWLPRARASIQ